MTKTTLPFHNTTTEERIMRTFSQDSEPTKPIWDIYLFYLFWRVSKERLINKLTRLKYESQMANPVYNPKLSPVPAIVNISSKKLSYVQEKVLEQRPKFSYLPKQVPVSTWHLKQVPSPKQTW